MIDRWPIFHHAGEYTLTSDKYRSRYAELSIDDQDEDRSAALADLLSGLDDGPDPAGCGMVCNTTSMGSGRQVDGSRRVWF